jgi:hypothetical protein
MEFLQNVAYALLIAGVSEIVVEYLLGQPLEQAGVKKRWWLVYPAAAIGAAIGWFANVNVFAGTAMDAVAGQAITAVLIGGGPELLHRIVRNGAEAVEERLLAR